jgi:DNA-binding NarL/FixJ family response regulator
MLKEVRTEDLLSAMRTVGNGGSTLDPATSATVMEQIRNGNVLSAEDRQAQTLNERELQVLELIAEGLTNREMGERLYLSEKTIKHHVSDILSKLGFSRRVEAATFAIRRRAQHPE